MKKIVQILSLVVIVTMCLTILGGPIANATSGVGTDVSGQVDQLFNGGSANVTQINTVGSNIVSIVTTIGIIVAVVILLVLGIKYMMGSAAEKAEYKKTMIPYLIGAVLIFSASAIAKAIIAVTSTITAS